MPDLPAAPALLALARDVLLKDLLPALPQELLLDARLVANSMAIAEREAVSGKSVAEEIIGELEVFYVGETLTHPALRAGSPPSRTAGEGAEPSKGGKGEPDALRRRFARDLRAGAFEDSRQRERGARGILWRLTIAKLRLANPRFLAANGFS